MPKLNVQQSNQNVIQAFRNALAIGNLKGIIASDGNHNFSTAGSNRNLLDNPFFTIRQRGDGPFTSAGNTLDRWKAVGNTTITGEAGGMRMEASTTYRGVSQFIETPAALANLTLTFSADITSLSGNIFVQIYDGAGAQILVKELSEGLSSVTFTAPANGIKEIYLTNRASTSVNVLFRAVKLELGSVSTLANDAPPDYYDELDHCKWYFERIKALSGNYAPMGFGYAASATAATIFVPMHAKRGSGYTVSTSGSFHLVNGQTTYSVTAISKYSSVPNNWLILTVTSSGMTAGQPLEFGARGDSAAYIDVNNDL